MPDLIIYGSPKKSSFTMELLEKSLNEDISSFEFYDCFEKIPKPCIDCGYCKENEGCCFDDLKDFFENFKNAKKVIFAFPVYNGSFPAPLKALIDRFQFLYNDRFYKKRRPPIEGVRDVTLVITAGAKSDPLPIITNQLSPLFTICGCKLKKAIVLTGTDSEPTLIAKDF